LTPQISILPPSQRVFWAEKKRLPEHFVLYGGTALALRLGHRQSIDFDFFSSLPLDVAQLSTALPFLRQAEVLQSEPDTLVVRIDRGGPVTVSLFGGLSFGELAAPDALPAAGVRVASLLDLFATKLKAVFQRSEAKDYLDIAAIIEAGVPLAKGLAGARALFGPHFNVALPLKALTYFGDGDLETVPRSTRELLVASVKAVQELPPVQLHAASIGG
jgi:hypothetical protein